VRLVRVIPVIAGFVRGFETRCLLWLRRGALLKKQIQPVGFPYQLNLKIEIKFSPVVPNQLYLMYNVIAMV